MPWWSWIIAGLVLLVAEIAAPGGFFLFFFGVSALLIGILVTLGLLASEAMQWALFSIFALAAIVLFRKKLQGFLPPRKSGDDADTMVGTIGVASETLAPAAQGKVEFRGSSWNARNVGASQIENGAACIVVSVDGLTLSVKSV